MWCNVIKTLERSFISNSQKLSKIYFNNQTQRFSGVLRGILNENTIRIPSSGASDGEYIVPYKGELEKFEYAKKLIIDTLRTKFNLSNEAAEDIINDKIVMKTCRRIPLVSTIEVLLSEGVKKQNLIEYPWLITLDKKILMYKISLLKCIHGFRDINDFVPLLRLHQQRMRTLVASLNKESKYLEQHGNRVYFIADKLNILPRTVTKYLAKRLFVLEMPFEMFNMNLQHMINYNVEPMNMLKDLWGFRYSPGGVELRLKRALQAKKDKIMPWMVRCPEPILQKSLQLTIDELEVLGEKTSVAEYVGERLGFNAAEAQAIMDKHRQVNTVRVTKIKEVLDYLLNEAKFDRYEIAQVPRILCHSLKTTKERIEELKKIGCRPSSLVIVCRSKREYQKFLQQWQTS